ncbi:hypothetical protein LTR66_005629 [Elasticomyces elasticus]|nr:hypothetical protein LTR66_005629 [Elasticomyces elasticus]
MDLDLEKDSSMHGRFAQHMSEIPEHQYRELHDHLVKDEAEIFWDAPARASASPTQLRAADIILRIREYERTDPNLYGNVPSEAIPGPETRDMGGQFLTNKDRIDRSRVFNIARHLPKGGHLHLHFNSELPPEVLIAKARDMPAMFVRSTQPMPVADRHQLTVPERQAFDDTEIVFNVLPISTSHANIYSADYNPEFRSTGCTPWMPWSDFIAAFPSEVASTGTPEAWSNAERWVKEKMILTEKDAYSYTQTHNGVWACFNQGTRCFKGLLNYESIFRWYIGAAVDSMIKDGVMYAELRPMLLDKSIPSDDGERRLHHSDQMRIILEEVEKKKAELKAEDRLHLFPFGLKIIYCTPRSIPRNIMERELQDCLRLKQEFPNLICGFDLVGAEDRPNNIGFYADLLIAFAQTCKSLNISIPFMFHAGETLLDTGGSNNPQNSNLYDSLLLSAKRIGHGFSLMKHPLLVQKYKEANICIEVCPISNELLHLCRNVKEHPFPQLLAAGIHCTINSDNPSLFRGAIDNSSSLSYEFYQVMVGSTTMNLHGWRQLTEWSIEYSCLSATEKAEAYEILGKAWESYCVWIVDEYGAFADTLPAV